DDTAFKKAKMALVAVALVMARAALELRLSGANTDAGRVEVRYNNLWGAVCADDWGMAEAREVCLQLGFFAAVAAGTWHGEHGLPYFVTGAKCDLTGSDCLHGSSPWPPPSEGYTCRTLKAASVACVSTHTAMPEPVSHLSKAIAAAAAVEMQQRIADEEVCSSLQVLTACDLPASYALPDLGAAIDKAYVYPDLVRADLDRVASNLNKLLCANHTLLKEIETLAQFSANAAGVTYNRQKFIEGWSDVGEANPWTVLEARLEASSVVRIFMETNTHLPIHWNLDEPWRLVRPGEIDDTTSSRPLHTDGILPTHDWGLTSEELAELNKIAEAELKGVAFGTGNLTHTSIISGGAVGTARVALPPIERLLKNDTLVSIISGYLGDDVTVAGYKITKLSSVLDSDEQYIAAKWHHDRVGRRLKMFIFLHDVDCEDGRPTQVALGTHELLYYKTESFAHSRFKDEWVRSTYRVAKGCGPAGGGFLFDTHALHRGTEKGTRERTTIIIEFHNTAKCPFVVEHGLGLPCPSGDAYMLNQRMSLSRLRLPSWNENAEMRAKALGRVSAAQGGGALFSDSWGRYVPNSSSLRWRFLGYDVIPPIPPAALLWNPSSGNGATIPAMGVCYRKGLLGVIEFDGIRGGGCVLPVEKLDGTVKPERSLFSLDRDEIARLHDGSRVIYGDFYILLNRGLPTTPSADFSQKDKEIRLSRFRKLINQYVSRADAALFHEVTGFTTEETVLSVQDEASLMDTLTACHFLDEVLGPARFHPAESNAKGLHLLRVLLGERMTDHRRQSLMNSHGASFSSEVIRSFATFHDQGYVLLDYHRAISNNGTFLRSFLQLVSAGDPVQDDLSFVPRVITHLAGDTQCQSHVDTFHSTFKMWVYPQNVSAADGPLHFLPTTHRATPAKLRWMWAVTKANLTAFDVAEPSLRLWDAPATYGLPEPVPVIPLPNYEWTLIVADTSGIHFRGIAAPGSERIALRPIGGQNDGGLTRRTPFREVPDTQ
ncbi:hypothetical protein DIPPA_19151, partial [Diplonema papillatum]